MPLYTLITRPRIAAKEIEGHKGAGEIVRRDNRLSAAGVVIFLYIADHIATVHSLSIAKYPADLFNSLILQDNGQD